jgi:copper(I)-binding protein
MAMRCLLFLVAFSAFFSEPYAAVKGHGVIIDKLTTKILNGAKNGAAYVKIQNNNSHTVTLYKVEVTPEVFDRVELHDHIERTDAAGNKYMQMIEIPTMEIAAGETLSLFPGSRHLMLMDIKQTYCGEKTLTFKFSFRKDSGQTFYINVEVSVLKDSQRCGG